MQSMAWGQAMDNPLEGDTSMKRSIAAAAASLAMLFAGAAAASAAPTPTFSTAAMGNQTVAFDASASPCTYGPCGYTWTYFNATTNRLGVQMGRVAKVDYRFPAFGLYTVVLKVSDRCSKGSSSWCWATTSKSVGVTY
jgi:hypothetical protein